MCIIIDIKIFSTSVIFLDQMRRFVDNSDERNIFSYPEEIDTEYYNKIFAA